MDSATLNAILGAAATVGTLATAAIGVLWRKSESRADETIAQLKERVLASERERIAATQRAEASESGYAKLKGEYKATVDALHSAQEMIDPGAMVGIAGRRLDPEQDPTGVFYVKAARARELLSREEADRRRSSSLNPEAERLERERREEIDRLQQRYLQGSSVPPRPPPRRR